MSSMNHNHDDFQRLSEVDVLKEVGQLKAAVAAAQQEWDLEVAEYEKHFIVKTGILGRKRLPRRNYPNEQGVIDDPALFPYDTMCYALLDAYDSFFIDNDEEIRAPYDGKTFKNLIIMQGRVNQDDDDDGRYEDLFYEQHIDGAVPSYLPNSQSAMQHSLENLTQHPERNDILLKLLKHSMSDLQCDHRFSRMILLKMAKWKSLQELTTLRRFLAIVLTEKRVCNGRCDTLLAGDDDVPDHFCPLWLHLEDALGDVLGKGIDNFTVNHALLICAFFKMTLDEANPGAGETEDKVISNKDSESPLVKSRTNQLKQAIYLFNQTDFDSDSDDSDEESEIPEGDVIPYAVFGSFLNTLDSRIEQCQRTALDPVHQVSPFDIATASAMLVYFGETAVRRVPSKREAMRFCGSVVRCLVTIYCGPRHIDPEELLAASFMPPHNIDYRIYMQYGLSSILDSNRYADRILKAPKTVSYSSESDLARPRAPSAAADSWTPLPPNMLPRATQDVFDVIKCLFGRDLVDLESSGCGYGDCMVWMRGPITANDPHLFLHSDNYRMYSSDDSYWVSETVAPDEVRSRVGNGVPLKDEKVGACYDFSLLKLLRAWHMPWTVDSHHSFQRPFRAAAKTVLLCINRVGLPNEIAHSVIAFTPRTFWPDERARCWCSDCLIENSVSLMTWKLAGQKPEQAPKMTTTKYCPGCSVVMYKKAEHRKQDAGNHCKDCNKPPYRIPGPEEAKFCRAVSAMMAGDEEAVDMVDDDDAVDDDGSWDEEGSWESIDSEENQSTDSAQQLVSSFIFDWFNQKTYKSHKSHESGFLAMYNRDD